MTGKRALGARGRQAASVLAVAAMLAGCAQAAPHGGYEVTLLLADALDVVPGAAVTVDGAPAGTVESVELAGFTAEVKLRLDSSAKLPDNAVAEVRHESLLGSADRTIELAAPSDTEPRGRLSDGDVIALARSGNGLAVEEVLSAFSVLIAGAGLEQLRTISTELSAAFKGREQSARTVLHDLERIVAGLDDQRSDLVAALDSVDRLTARLAAQRGRIAAAIDTLGPGLKVLAEQREQLTGLLAALARLGEVGGRVVAESRAATLADLRALAPILASLQRAGTALPRAMELIATYPFPRSAGGAISDGLARMYATADLSKPPTQASPAPEPGAGSNTPSTPAPEPAPNVVAGLPDLLLDGLLE